MNAITITCESCAMRATQACEECLVTFLCDEDDDAATSTPGGAPVLDLDDERAVRMLVSAGLVPTIRHRATG